MKDYEYIEIVKNNSESSKRVTDVYEVINKTSGAKIGTVKWHSSWRQYCFFPEPDTVYSKGCMENINQFIQEKMEERKE